MRAASPMGTFKRRAGSAALHLRKLVQTFQVRRWASWDFLSLILLTLVCVAVLPPRAVAQDAMEPFEGARVVPVDLAPFASRPVADFLATASPGSFIPNSSNRVGAVTFVISGALELAPTAPVGGATQALARVRGIPIGRKFAAIHLLHATPTQATEGALVGSVVLFNNDTAPASLPLIYGEHVRAASDPNATVLDSNTRLASPATNTTTPAGLRWHRTTILNPFPDKEVESLDFVAGDAGTAEVILAASIGGTADDARPHDSAPPGFDDFNKVPLRFMAVDAVTSRPVEGLRVKVGVAQNNVSSSLGAFLTDARGECVVPLPSETMTFLHIYMSKDGYVQKSYRWYRRSPDDARQGGINTGTAATSLAPPTNFLFRADPAPALGGVVRDEKDEPVAGAVITVQNFVITTSGNRGEQLSMTGVEAVTDAAGRWRLACLPRNYTQFSLDVEHPEFTRTTFVPSTRTGTVPGIKVPMAALLATNAVFPLQRGLGLPGIVTDRQGRGVAGARILLGDSRYRTSSSSRAPSAIRADGQGRFRLPAQARGKVTLTVQAPGFAPEMTEVMVQLVATKITVKLAPGAIIRGRVLDASGLPVAETRVSISQWRQKQTLEWSARTDGEGRFEWDSAPEEPVMLYFYKEGYVSQGLELTPTNGEQIVRLMERPLVAGRVFDAESKLPVSSFTIMTGRQYGPGSFSWNNSRSFTDTGGEFSLPLDDAGSPMVLKVSAPGYRAFTSAPFNPNEGVPALDFAMQRGTGLRGVVRRPDGSPLPGAQVAAVGRNSYVALGRGGFDANYGSRNEIARTDTTGRFVLPEVDDLLMVVAAHPAGYAEARADELQSLTNLVVEAWGRIEGEVRIGSRAGTNLQLVLSYGDPQIHQLQFSYQYYRIITDEEGHFSVTNVPPGDRALFRLIPISASSQMWSQRTEVAVEPGSTNHVVIGGTGRPVIGRALAPNSDKPIDWTQCQGNINSVQTIPPPSTGGLLGGLLSSFANPARRVQQRNYGFACAADGSFRVEDVPAGTYSISVSAMETEQLSNNSRTTRTIGFGNKSLTIPPMPGGRSDETLDAGEIEIRLNR